MEKQLKAAVLSLQQELHKERKDFKAKIYSTQNDMTLANIELKKIKAENSKLSSNNSKLITTNAKLSTSEGQMQKELKKMEKLVATTLAEQKTTVGTRSDAVAMDMRIVELTEQNNLLQEQHDELITNSEAMTELRKQKAALVEEKRRVQKENTALMKAQRDKFKSLQVSAKLCETENKTLKKKVN